MNVVAQGVTNKQTYCQVFIVIKPRFIQRPNVIESKKTVPMQTKCSNNNWFASVWKDRKPAIKDL